mmetsp:Transcript_43142/g.99399  ORF Transcript_43142/g.99399 Transcript_43142/m.99399 type:complete len:325 (-) Transcript_43142:48-1022(-)
MLSDDDDLPLVGRSPSPQAPRGKGGGKGDRGGKTGDRGPPRGRTSGRELPALNSIHKGTVVRVQSFGAFVRLGDGSKYKDGLLHISRLSASGRVEKVEDVVTNDDVVWVKVCEVRDEEGKFSVDMRFVGQKDGEDKDPNNTQADAGGGGKGKGKPPPIRIGAVQATTCSRCGAKGHSARECWAAGGAQYDLLEEPPASERLTSGPEGSSATLGGHPTEVARRALKAYIHGKDDLLSDDEEKKAKKAKKEKKKDDKKKKKEKKKEKKKGKKEEKKLKKLLKRQAKRKAEEEASKSADASATKKTKSSGKDGAADRSSSSSSSSSS